MPSTAVLLTMLTGTMAALGAAELPDLLSPRLPGVSDVVDENVRQVARIRIATAGILSGGEPEGSIDVEGRSAAIMLAFYRPATALQIADYYRREFERRQAKVLFQCEGRNCGLGGFSHWPGGYSSYAAGNTASQIYIAAKFTEESGERYVTVHAVENTSSRLASRPQAAGTVFIQTVSGKVIGSKTASAISIWHDPGANVQRRTVREFDEIPVYFSAKTANAKPRILSGKVAITVLTVPDDRSLLDVFQKYKSAVEAAGFTILFSCRDRECGDGMEDFYLHSDIVRRITDVSKTMYLVARRERDGKVDHVYVFARSLGHGVDVNIGTVEGKKIADSQ